MKGTIKRGQNKAEDRVLKAKLKNDPKTRSENLMIVDLLRNDMSKIIKVGSLRIKKPMKIIKLKTLFQAISPLKAKLKNRNLSKIFNAVFPHYLGTSTMVYASISSSTAISLKSFNTRPHS